MPRWLRQPRHAVVRDEGGTPSRPSPRPKKSWVALLAASGAREGGVRREERAEARELAEDLAVGGSADEPARRRDRFLELAEQRLEALPVVPRARCAERDAVRQLDDERALRRLLERARVRDR